MKIYRCTELMTVVRHNPGTYNGESQCGEETVLLRRSNTSTNFYKNIAVYMWRSSQAYQNIGYLGEFCVPSFSEGKRQKRRQKKRMKNKRTKHLSYSSTRSSCCYFVKERQTSSVQMLCGKCFFKAQWGGKTPPSGCCRFCTKEMQRLLSQVRAFAVCTLFNSQVSKNA